MTEPTDSGVGANTLAATTQKALGGTGVDPGQWVPALTVLCHPDIHRVGEEARLAALSRGEDVELSRLSPHFAQPGSTQGRPLADTFVSRKPIVLSRANAGMTRVMRPDDGTEIRVNGEAIGETIELAPEALQQGVVLDLANRVVLLLHRLPPPGKRPPQFSLIGDSSGMELLRNDVLRVTDLDVPVLLRGESGSGKELVARAIHDAGPRRDQPCVCINMAAISATTATSELFGHVRGAFTGADRDHPGFFQSADGGTLFLDEIGETPPDVQALLLRALETGEIQPVGAKTTRNVDVRFIAATDRDLEAAATDGRFRLPLLHRLAGYQMHIPPLRDRRDDIGRLLVHFLRVELAATGETERLDSSEKEPWLTASLVDRLARYDWPGNVRQLRNVARQLVISSRGAPALRIDVAVEKLLAEPREHAEETPTISADSPDESYRKPDQVSENELVEALRANQWRLGPTAKALGVSRTSTYALIDRSDLIRRATDLTREEIEKAMDQCGGDVDAMVERLEISKRGLQLRMKELGIE